MTSSYSNGDAQDIWEAIFSGASVEVSFIDEKDAERLRVRLYQIKKSKEKLYTDLGYLAPDEIQSLLFEHKQHFDGIVTAHYYQISLGKRKREAKQYTFRIIETPSSEDPSEK